MKYCSNQEQSEHGINNSEIMGKYKPLEEMIESVQGLMGTEVQNKTSNNAEACPLVAVKGTADTGYDTSVSVFDDHSGEFMRVMLLTQEPVF